MDLDWKFAYQIGVETLDNEHRLFLSLIKKVQLSTNKVQELQSFDELIRYIRYHFESEEKLMEIHKYSKLEEHKLAHFKLLDRITEFQTGIELGTFNKDDLSLFLQEWFLTHTTAMDRHFSRELNEQPEADR